MDIYDCEKVKSKKIRDLKPYDMFIFDDGYIYMYTYGRESLIFLCLVDGIWQDNSRRFHCETDINIVTIENLGYRKV